MKTNIEMPEPDGMDVDDICYYTADQMREYAALVRADENKACQDVCDDVYRAWTLRDDEDETDPPDPIDCKLAIRARGNT